MTGKTITHQQASLFYRVTGKGRPVVLIHGFGEDGSIWDKQVDVLKDHYQLIIPDLPGSGRSEVDSRQLAASIEAYAEIVKAILDAEKIMRCEMMGHSMGGYITLAFAEKYPGMLSSFGLIHSSAFADSEEKKAARLKSIEFIRKNGAYEFLRSVIPGLFFSGQNGSKPVDPYIEELVEKGRHFTDEALTRYYQAMIARPDRTQILKTFAGPILFIIGEHDKAVPMDDSLKQCYIPHRSHIHILRQSAHMGMHEESAKTNNIFLEFLG